ncbi:response regulator transcription factor [Actinomadura fulvescens]|uniref:Response regulator transcription factor n=1 Tax=Actinomadura fulvescens TaxID=46160 RepID=A0ABP6CJR3_9ACTN
MDKATRILIVDDEPMVCVYLGTILNTADDLEVVDTVHDGAAAVESAVRHRPDIVLMDLRMPGVDGFTAIEHITAMRRPPTVVALTTFDADHYVLRALHAGAAGFLLKSIPPKDLIDLMRVAAKGHTVLSTPATSRLLAATGRHRTMRDGAQTLIDKLTGREAEVLACLGEGLTNAQIARRLCLTEGTVKNHISRVLDKLQCTNRTQAGLLAHQAGMYPR